MQCESTVCEYCFLNDTATTEIYTLSLHDALPIWYAPETVHRAPHGQGGQCRGRQEDGRSQARQPAAAGHRDEGNRRDGGRELDRKSTRLNSSHANISYAVFCLKK